MMSVLVESKIISDDMLLPLGSHHVHRSVDKRITHRLRDKDDALNPVIDAVLFRERSLSSPPTSRGCALHRKCQISSGQRITATAMAEQAASLVRSVTAAA
jgi:hypothetical protein